MAEQKNEDIKSKPYSENKFGRPLEDYPDVTRESLSFKSFNIILNLFSAPGKLFNDICQKNRRKHIYYHEKFNRVPTIDECYTDDLTCIKEADLQYLRDKSVESAILNIILKRFENCIYYHNKNFSYLCKEAEEDYKKYKTIYHLKYGDLSKYATSANVYMKQKHRMILKRREEEKLKNVKN